MADADRFFADIYQGLVDLPGTDIPRDAIDQVIAGGESALKGLRDLSYFNSLLLASSHKRGTLAPALGAFFEVRPLQQCVEAVEADLDKRYPGLLDAPSLASVADSIMGEEETSEVSEEHPTEEVEEGQAVEASVGVDSVSAGPMIFLTPQALALPGIQLKVRDTNKVMLFDRSLPVEDAMFLASALLQGTTNALRLYAMTVQNRERKPADLVEEVGKWMGRLSGTLEHLKTIAIELQAADNSPT